MRVRPDVRSQMLVLPCLWYFAYFQIKVLSEHILEDSVHWQQKIGGIDSGFSLAKAVLSSVAQLCPTFCDPMNCSVPGLPVHHQLLEFTQTHVDWVSDAIQPSHPLSSPSPPAFNLSQHQGLSNESVLCIRWPKYWSFSFSISPSSEYSVLISFRID